MKVFEISPSMRVSAEMLPPAVGIVVTFCSEINAYKLIPFRHTVWNSCHAAQVYGDIIQTHRVEQLSCSTGIWKYNSVRPSPKLRFSVSYSGDIAFKFRLGYLLVFLSAPKHAGILTYHTSVRLRTFPYTCFPVHVSLSSCRSILYNFRS
jgi:hypothetical protein